MADRKAARSTKEATPEPDGRQYVVVARRYRPQTFNELIGQEHVARGLSNAISLNRVGHAYLFTGARGVGKTSAARILAKALNCEKGPTPTPCNECDICRAISTGDDVDVLEIDGASNRGIDEIRQLRQNVNVRPSRARFKIYIIDEVHMLTREAFNALLKTLEEPPEHVKFIFCTTEAEKIPITILSRCQRFDFAGIQAPSIVERLEQIVQAEGVTAERSALEILARRAAGSMRDSQSLLEQLLAFGERQITAADVHAMLGTATSARLTQIVQHLVRRNAANALAEVDAALTEGVDPGQLLDQLMGYLRDCMAAAVGSPPEAFLYASPSDQADVKQAAGELGLATILAMIQIVEQTLAGLRYSSHARTLAEMAIVRMCKLEDLQAIPDLIASLRNGAGGQPPASSAQESRAVASPKKKAAELEAPPPPHFALPTSDNADPPADGLESPAGPGLTDANASAVWNQALTSLGDMVAENARYSAAQAIRAPNFLVATFPVKYNSCKLFCERPEHAAKLERALGEAAGKQVRVEFKIAEETTQAEGSPQARRPVSKQQRMVQKAQTPYARRVIELFDAHPVRLDEPNS